MKINYVAHVCRNELLHHDMGPMENILSVQLSQNNMFYQYFDDWLIKYIKAK